MTNLIEPNVHPIIVHFVIAFLTAGPIALLVSAIGPRDSRMRASLQAAGDWMLALGVVFAGLALAAGLQAYYSVNHDAPSHAAMKLHRNWAFGTVGVFLVLAFWRFTKRSEAPTVLNSGLLVLAMSLVLVTGFKGAELVYQYGLGVASLPTVTGDGHDHDHGDGGLVEKKEAAAESTANADGHNHEHAAKEAVVETEAPDDAVTSMDMTMMAPKDVVAAYHRALEESDAAQVQSILLPDVFIAESGGAERSAAEYASHHMPIDMKFSAAVKAALKAQKEMVSDDMAWVVSERISKGEYNGQAIHVRLMETMVLTRTEEGWKIAHIHWSSAPIKMAADGHEHEH